MGSPTAKDNTFGEALHKFGTKAAGDLAELRYLPDSDDQVVAALDEAIQTIVQAFMRDQFNGANAQGGGVQIPQQMGPEMMGGGGPSFLGAGAPGGTTRGYGDEMSRSISRLP